MSLKNHSLIVSLTVRKPKLSSKDAKATQDAELANNASGAGKYTKDLYPKDLIAPIMAVESAARAHMVRHTYPWGRARGSDLLPTTKFMEFADKMADFELQFSQAVTVFLNNWSNVLMRAQAAQGDMFDATDYPDVSDLRGQFSFEVSYAPVTDISDFRVAMSEEETERIREAVERDMQQAQQLLMEEPVRRLRKAVARLVETTGAERTRTDKRTGATEDVSPIFRATLVGNLMHEVAMIREFADMLPARVSELATTAAEVAPHPDALRSSPELRQTTHVNAKALLAAIEEML